MQPVTGGASATACCILAACTLRNLPVVYARSLRASAVMHIVPCVRVPPGCQEAGTAEGRWQQQLCPRRLQQGAQRVRGCHQAAPSRRPRACGLPQQQGGVLHWPEEVGTEQPCRGPGAGNRAAAALREACPMRASIAHSQQRSMACVRDRSSIRSSRWPPWNAMSCVGMAGSVLRTGSCASAWVHVKTRSLLAGSHTYQDSCMYLGGRPAALGAVPRPSGHLQ